MKLFNVLLVSCVVFFFSCKNDKKINESEISEKTKIDSTSVDQNIETTQNTINLEAVTAEVPHFNNKEADAFVNKTKIYFEQMAQATQANNSGKILELQSQAVDIDTEMQKVKNNLNSEQQKQLTDWYMKLVDAASK